jgi:uncharacterized repeat protein (TIGR01451 family)
MDQGLTLRPSSDGARTERARQGANTGNPFSPSPGNTVSVIDTATNTVTTTIINTASAPFAVAITPDGTRAYVTGYQNAGAVSVIDTATNTVTTTITTGIGNFPAAVAITPDGTRAYVANQGNSHNVSVIDTATNSVTTAIPVSTAPSGIAITPDGSRAYVPGDSGVDVIDTTTNTVTDHVGTNSAVGVAITQDGTRAYVAVPGGPRAVDVIDTATNAVTATIAVGNSPQQVAIAPAAPPSGPSLTINKTHTGTFTPGRQGTYTITVGNNGTSPTDGTTVTVHDTLPAQLTAIRLAGSGWNCVRSTLTCTRSDVLNPGSSYPAITLRVRVARNTPPQIVTNTVTVTGGGDTTTHTATDPTTIDPSWCHHEPGHHKPGHHKPGKKK